MRLVQGACYWLLYRLLRFLLLDLLASVCSLAARTVAAPLLVVAAVTSSSRSLIISTITSGSFASATTTTSSSPLVYRGSRRSFSSASAVYHSLNSPSVFIASRHSSTVMSSNTTEEHQSSSSSTVSIAKLLHQHHQHQQEEAALPTPKVLFVNGYRGNRNNVVCMTRENASENVIFFPGDVQTFYKDMVADEDYSEYTPFSLECTVDLLYKRFQDANIWIICPSRFTQNHLSEYDSLLRPGEGIMQFCTIFSSAVKAIQDDEMSATAMMEKPIKLVAFSKGGLVLNHILAELASTIKLRKNVADGVSEHETLLDWEAEYMASLLPNYEPSQRIGRTKTPAKVLLPHEETVFSFVDKVSTIHWVDCHRYPTNPEVVRLISDYLTQRADHQHRRTRSTSLFIHLTPRQYSDRRRKWIQRENDDFVALLKENHVPFFLEHYLQDHPKTLQTHFELLKIFHTSNLCSVTPVVDTTGGCSMLSSCSNAPPTIHVQIPSPTCEDTSDDTTSMMSVCRHNTTPIPNTRFYHPSHS